MIKDGCDRFIHSRSFLSESNRTKAKRLNDTINKGAALSQALFKRRKNHRVRKCSKTVLFNDLQIQKDTNERIGSVYSYDERICIRLQPYVCRVSLRLQHWSETGAEPKTGDQDLRYYLDQEEKRLEKRYIREVKHKTLRRHYSGLKIYRRPWNRFSTMHGILNRCTTSQLKKRHLWSATIRKYLEKR